jgi:hypothetical protein
MLNPFKFIGVLKDIKKDGGMYLCEGCLKNIIKKQSPEDTELAYRTAIDSKKFMKMELERDCFVCGWKTNLMIGVTDAMDAIGKNTTPEMQRMMKR